MSDNGKDSESSPWRVWCSQHDSHPNDCWEYHVLFKSTERLTEEERQERLRAEHLRLQRASQDPEKEEETS